MTAATTDAAPRRSAPTSGELRADLVLAAAILIGALLSSVLYRIAGFFEEPAPGWATIPYALGVSAPLIWRRRHPSVVAVVVSATFIAAGTFMVPEVLIGNIALFIAFYSVGAWDQNRMRAHVVRLVITAAMIVWLFLAIYLGTVEGFGNDQSTGGAFSPFVAFTLIQVITNLLYFGGAYYYGERARASALERRALDARTAELEHERGRLAEQAVALDRVRIARELHDSVAHHVSVMGVQAGAARASLASDPETAGQALRHVEDTARSAIDELHGLLQTLRDAGAEPDTSPASTVGVAALPALVQASADAGLPTDLEIVGDPRPLPPTLSLNVYRIAQEALTNARKHAGPDAEAEVRLRYLADAVELEVANTGTTRTRRAPGGLGQLGMRERVATSGGSLEVGPRSRGGYLVRARLPLAAS